MIVDTSALLAIVLDEPEGERMALALTQSSRPRMSAANWLEAAIVIDSRGDATARKLFDDMIAPSLITLVAVDAAMAERARSAYRQYGRGHHPARLNYGDCFSYALAKEVNAPLLFKGNDFSQTDIIAAFY